MSGDPNGSSMEPESESATGGNDENGETASGKTPAGLRLVDLEELELTIEKLVAGGDGLARWEGVPIFVPRTAPGDRLRVRITERRPDYGRGEVLEILEPGPGRREAPCPYFARCGGCDLQHIDDERQPLLKAEAAWETLLRLGRLELPEAPELITGDAWAYRLRTQLHVRPPEPSPEPSPEKGSENEAAGGPGLPRVGYHARGSHELVEVDRCPILVPEIDGELLRLPSRLGGSYPRRLDLTCGDEGRITSAPRNEAYPGGEVTLTATVGGAPFTYAYDARTFFQAHRGLVGRLIEVAVGDDEGGAACDLYGGVGLFALPLARRYRQVTLVEGDRIAVRFARNNARRNRVDNVELVNQAVETWMRRPPSGLDRVLVDPPRAGLAKPVRRALAQEPPRRLTYVSCHVATLARDLRQLSELYRVQSVTFLDLFPQTGHIETVAQLALR